MAGYEEDGQRYVSLAGLRVRGWTGGMVHRLLGPPDRLSINPRFRAAPPTRLYRVERVEAAERSEEFRVVVEAAARQSEAVRAALRQRQEEVMERIRAEPIDVPRLDPGKLALRAVGHRARVESEAGQQTPSESRRRAPAESGQRAETAGVTGQGAFPRPTDRASLDPWKVDYLRHRLISQYDQLLDGLPGGGDEDEDGDKPAPFGRAEAVALLQRRICAAVAEAYPDLAYECERQRRTQGPGPPPR